MILCTLGHTFLLLTVLNEDRQKERGLIICLDLSGTQKNTIESKRNIEFKKLIVSSHKNQN